MELDIEDFDALRTYLTTQGHLKSKETVSFKKLPGGVSNRTVRVLWPAGQSWVLKQALAKLRVSIDWFSNPERIGVEAKALRSLNRLAPPGTTPAFVFEDMTNYVMAMEAIPEDHHNWKSVLLSGSIVTSHFKQFGFLLATIHRRSSESAAEFRTAFADTTYFENLRLDPYYLYAAQNIAEASEFLTNVSKETLRHKHCLVHGDFSPKNTLIYHDKLILLDYEVVHFGDPAFDLGFALTHFLSKANHLPNERFRLASAAELFWQTYREELAKQDWTADLEGRAARHTLACLLARVAGKSPLEYLSPEEKVRQREIVLSLIKLKPARIPGLITEFVNRIEKHAQN